MPCACLQPRRTPVPPRLVCTPAGRHGSVPTEPQGATLAQVVDRAADVVDPLGRNDGVAYVVEHLQDRDEPVSADIRSLELELAELIGRVDPQSEDPAVTMMSAVILHLAHRRDELDADPARILEQAARDEFHGKPPQVAAEWLAEQGISL
jgi:hypothetical protein